MNDQLLSFTISVDVDRESQLYSKLAVGLLNPKSRGIVSKGEVTTVEEADILASKHIALSAARALLGSDLDEAVFGKTSIRIVSPKNLSELIKQEDQEHE